MFLTYPQIQFTFAYITSSKTQSENQNICGIATSALKLLHHLPPLRHLALHICLCLYFQMLSHAQPHIQIYLYST